MKQAILILGLAAALTAGLGIKAAAAQGGGTTTPAPSSPTTFATAEAAARELTDALTRDDIQSLLNIFGQNQADFVIGADPVNARNTRQRAGAMAREKTVLRRDADDRVTLVLGNQRWPMPIPLVKTGRGWMFDTEAGLEQVLERRIGANELSAIATLQTFVRAELDYAARRNARGESVEYARFVQSSPGATNGLWWDQATAAEAGPSPLASFVAAQEDFLRGRQVGDPFRGYYFRILTGQGPRAPGGAKSYVADGRMTNGFAMIAWPADYAMSGIMTFMVDRSGRVLQKDLGEETASRIATMLVFDPDEGWGPAEPSARPAR